MIIEKTKRYPLSAGIAPFMPTRKVLMTVLSVLFTALMALGASIRIPIGPVPIAATSFFVLTAGLMLGPKWGLAATALYLLLGTAGFPIFTGGGGAVLLAGPTGGYLLGYCAAAVVTGSLATNRRRAGSNVFGPTARNLIALVAGTLCIYLFGVVQLKLVMDLSWSQAVGIGILPFLLGDGIKIAAAASLKKLIG